MTTDLDFKIQIPKTRTAQNETEPLKLVVKLADKNENTSLEQTLYSTSEKIEKITFREIKIGSEVKISANIYDSGILLYTGETEYKKVEPTNNVFSLTLEKVNTEDIIDAKVPEIIIQPENKTKNTSEETQELFEHTLHISAQSNDGGIISFQWQTKKDNGEWENIDETNSTQAENLYSSILSVTIPLNTVKYYRCIVTNTNENVNGEKTASITSNEVSVSYLKGELTSITATYNSTGYEIFGSEFSDLETNPNKISIEETYETSNNDKIKIFANAQNYSIQKSTEVENAIGYVPYTVTYNGGTTSGASISTTMYVPVKYKLSADSLSISGTTNETATWGTESNPEQVAQHTGSSTLVAKYSSNISLYSKENSSEVIDFNILENCSISWSTGTKNADNSVTVDNSIAGDFTYTAALISNSEWIVGEEISAKYYITVCPWEIALTPEDGGDFVEPNNLSEKTNYNLSITNTALTANTYTPTWNVTEQSGFSIDSDSNKLSTPEATTETQTATITAKVGETEVASIEVTVAPKLGSEANPITTWTSLVEEMQNEGDAVYISGEMTANSILTIAKSRKIIAVDDVTINRASNYTGAIFTLNAPLTMTGSESAHITIDGNNKEVGQSMIYSTNQNITLEYVTIQNCKNTATYGGAIYLGGSNDESNSIELSIELSNCAFTNNTANGTSKGGGAIALYGTKITSNISNCSFNDNSASNSGGAIYIFGSGTENKQYTHTLENCTFSNNITDETNEINSGIYLDQGATIIDNLFFENDTDNYDIFICEQNTSYVTLKNKNMINKFGVRFGSEDTPEITLDDSFSTDSQINFECIAASGASVDSGDTLITTTEGNLLTQEEIDCFTITDKEGVTYTLNTNGTLSTSTDSSLQTAYYVSADGNDDNDGLSKETPFKTLKNAITKANNSGINQIYVIGTLNATSEGYSGGSGSGEAYSAFYIQDENLGSEENPLIIEGYGDSATLSADYDDSESNVRVFATKNSCHITMKNLTITGGTTTESGSALYYYGGVLTLEGCVIEGNSSSTKSDLGLEYDVYMYGSSKLNLTRTKCYDGIYLYSSVAYFGDECLLGYEETTDTPIMHIDNSTVTLSGSVSIFHPIYSDAKNPIYIDSTLTEHSDVSTGSKVSVVLSNYAIGTQIVSLTGSNTANLEDETAKFYLQDENYAIDTSGQIISQN